MTVKEAIDKTDALVPNVYPYSKKVSWLEELDMKTEKEFFSYFTDNDRVFEGEYQTHPDKVLLVTEPFSDIYIRYLALQAALYSGDTAAYQNQAQLFNSEYLSFMNHYSRSHKTRRVRINMD